MTTTKNNAKRFYTLLTLSLVMLFNPNVNVFDILPDFIGWFILAHLFTKAADSAAYFEEARSAFLKLGWLNVFKIPTLMLIFFIRSKNAGDTDIFALASICFAIVEVIFSISAVKNIFAALFHLGERTEAVSLISPVPSTFLKGKFISPDFLITYTIFFAVCKSILYTLPDMFLLTRTTDSGATYISMLKYYPVAILVSQLLGYIIGTIWLIRMLKYVNQVKKEGKFFEALSNLATEDHEYKFEVKLKKRRMIFSLTMMAVASFFSIELVFSDFNGINILPHFLYGIVLLYAVKLLSQFTDKKFRSIMFSGIGYIVISIVQYISKIMFLTNYSYSELESNSDARRFYVLIIILGVIEFISLAVFLVNILKPLKTFISQNTGLDSRDEKYNNFERKYHKELYKKANTLCVLGVISAFTKLMQIIINRNVKFITTNPGGMGESIFTASAVPWFNLVVTITAVIYIAYSLYFISTIKEELNIK